MWATVNTEQNYHAYPTGRALTTARSQESATGGKPWQKQIKPFATPSPDSPLHRLKGAQPETSQIREITAAFLPDTPPFPNRARDHLEVSPKLFVLVIALEIRKPGLLAILYAAVDRPSRRDGRVDECTGLENRQG